MIDLEQRANHPNRYKNRGGNLLMEEKERNKIRNKLPKIENDLLLLVEKYEMETGDSFLICGKKVSEIIAEAWEEHREQKHLLLSAKKQARENTRLTPGRSRLGQTHLQIPGSTPVRPLTATKRKLCTPTNTTPRKLLKNGLKTAPPKIVVSAPTVRRVSLFLLD